MTRIIRDKDNSITLEGVTLTIPSLGGTGGIIMPIGTTGERNATNGIIRYNSSLTRLEGYANDAWIDLGPAGAAPATAQYITLAVDGTLTVERVLTPGLGIDGADAGAGSTYTVAVDLNSGSWTTTTAVAGADLIPFEDVTDSLTKKRTWTNIIADINLAVTDAVQTFTAAQRGEVTGLTDGANIAIDMSLSNNFSVTLAGNRTLDNPTNAVAGQSGAIIVTQDAGGTNTLAYGANYEFEGGSTPVLTVTGLATDSLFYYVETSTKILITSGLDWQ